MSDWISSVIVCAALCGGSLYFLSGNPSQKSVKLLCGLIMSAVTVLPLGNLLKDFRSFSEEAFIFSDYGNTFTTDEQALGEALIRQTAEERLSALLQQEMARRLGREDFTLGVSSDGTAWLSCSEDFPREEAKQLLSALLGGCKVQIKGGKEGDG